MKIEILDSVECQVSVEDGKILFPLLSYEAIFWKQGPYKKVRKTYQKSAFSFQGKTHWRFYTGLLPRVRKWTEERGIQLEVVGEEITIPRQNPPILKGIKFRQDQLEMIDIACKIGRGSLIAPTQSGKTLVFLGIISCYPKLNILVLSHTATIVHQTYERLLKYGFNDVEVFGGGVTIKNPTKRITVSTIQSFIKLDPKFYIDYYDMVIVDELHRVSKQVSQYKQVLSQLLAPCRFGFTATPKDDPESELTYEGLIGPIISELSIQEAIDMDILQKPKIELINSVMPDSVGSIYKYQDTYKKVRENGKLVNGKRLEIGAYSACVVENVGRNNQIADLVVEKIKQGKIIFVFVTYTLHGQLIQDAIQQRLNIKVPFVEGATSIEQREKIKQGLQTKEIKVCVASNAWNEGLTVKTISNLFLVGAGSSELQLLQRAGRVLANENVTITYFLDSKNKHLALQSLKILSVFVDKGWL